MAADEPTPQATPWIGLAIAAAVGVVGLVVALAVLAPLVVLGALLLLAGTVALAYLLGRRRWAAPTQPRPPVDPAAIEALAEGHRAAARDRHAVTVAAVAAGLVPPGFGTLDDA